MVICITGVQCTIVSHHTDATTETDFKSPSVAVQCDLDIEDIEDTVDENQDPDYEPPK